MNSLSSLRQSLARTWLEPAPLPAPEPRVRLVRLSAVVIVNALALAFASLVGSEGQTWPMVGFILAIIATSWLGGRIFSLVAVVLATWAANYFLFTPGTLAVDFPEDFLRLASFSAVALLVSMANSGRAALERAERQRKAAELDREWTETLLDQGLAPTLLFDPETGELIFANQAARELAGGRIPMRPHASTGSGEFITCLGQELPPEDWPVARAARGEIVPVSQYEWHLPDGTRKLLVSARLLPGIRGHQPVVRVSYQDFTEAERAASALRRSEALYETLAESAPVGIFHVDADGTLLYANRRAAELLGFGDAPCSFRLADLCAEDAESLLEGPLFGYPVAFERRVAGPGGRERWLSISVSPLRDAQRVVSYVCTVDDLTSHKAVEDELRSLSEHRAELVTTVSHTLRGPIAAMLANLEVLQDTTEGRLEPVHSRLVANAVQASLNLSETVDHILFLSRLQRGKGVVTREQCTIPDILRDVYARMLPRALSRGLSLRLEVGVVAPVETDARLVEVVLTEFLENAIKYTPEGGRVILAADDEEDGARISVRDTGPGLAAEDLPHLFESFYRGQEADRSQTRGSGLGLAIVARTAALLGASVQAENRLEGGSMFELFLPRSPIRDSLGPTER